MALPEESVQLQNLKQKCQSGETNFRISPSTYCVFQAEAAKKAMADNYADMTLADRLSDLAKGRKSEPFSWQEIRSAWLSQMKVLSQGPALVVLADRMTQFFKQRHGQSSDLVWTIHQLITQTLTPVIISGLSDADQRIIRQDQQDKFEFLLSSETAPQSRWRTMVRHWRSLRLGNVVRRELKGRQQGKRPRQVDLLDPLVDMLPRLGLDRAVDAVVMVMTAIVGPPGAAALSTCYELICRPDWATTLKAELSAIPDHCFYAAPHKVAPDTSRFIKEVLRLWNVPVVLRRARTDLEIEGEQLLKDSLFYLSPYLIHRNPAYWQDPETFDPDRWLATTEHSAPEPGTYVPFGWSPKSCIGSLLGSIQLTILCRLLTGPVRIELENSQELSMTILAFPQPKNFYGKIVFTSTGERL